MSKNVPMRMCVSCRGRFEKTKLIRIVRGVDGNYFIDNTHKAEGRGCYVCYDENCVNKCIKSKMPSKNLKVNLPESLYKGLAEEYAKHRKS